MTPKQIRENLEQILAYQNSEGHQPLNPKTVLENLLHLTRAVEALEARVDSADSN